jgi:GNAT superfamily N-acetyltransferase
VRQASTVTAYWDLRVGPDNAAEDIVTDRLVEYNKAQAEIVRDRFRTENLSSSPVWIFAFDDGGLAGGAIGKTVDVWRWLTVDIMWVDETKRGRGLGRALLAAVENEARTRGCHWSKLNTWDFQAPGFYEHCGYVEYGREVDYPPGHTNF